MQHCVMYYDVDKLKAARIRRGISQRRLAIELSISNQVVSQVELGKNKSPQTLKIIADYLRIPMEEIVFAQDRERTA